MSEKLIIELIRTHSDFEQAATRFGLKGASKELYRRDKIKKELATRLATLERVAEENEILRSALNKLCSHMCDWGQREDGIPEEFMGDVLNARMLLRQCIESAALTALQPDSAKDMFETAVDVKAGLSPERGMAEQAAYEQAISDQATFAATGKLTDASALDGAKGGNQPSASSQPSSSGE